MPDIQTIYKLVLIFLYSFCATWWSLPYIIEKLKKYGFVTTDVYKRRRPKFVTMGGIGIFIGMLVSLSLSQILFSKEDLGRLFIFHFIVIIYGLYGLVDDLFKFKQRYDKILAILVLSFPIATLLTDTDIELFGTTYEFGWIFKLLIAPVYIMVVANLVNLHAGYNGLVTGNAWLLLLFTGIESYQRHGLNNLLFLLPVLGALTAFLPYNWYPARAHDGNVGAFLVGGTLGALLLANNMETFGVFILAPHIVNFFMDTWTIVIRRIPDAKFGTLRPDGTIEPPPTMRYKSLKFLLCSMWRLTERQATLLLMIPTLVFGTLGVLLF